MADITCKCGNKMINHGLKTDMGFGIPTERVEYICPLCGDKVFLDPEKV